MYGWTGQRLKVYLTEGRIVKEPLPDDLRLNYIGGRGLNSKCLFDEVRPGIDALGPENVVLIGVGPLNGTATLGSSRWTVTARSTVGPTLGDGNGGGDFSTELKFAGYDQIIFYGKSPKPVYLYINDDHIELRDASRLWGKTTGQTDDLLKQELHDPELRVMSIGPAGENLVRVAKVFTNRTRAGGKGGMGAVIGSKNLKAVAVRGSGSVKIARPKDFAQAVKRAYDKLAASLPQRAFSQQGTLQLVRRYAENGSLPTRNCQEGYFEGWENLTSEAFEAQFAVKHKGCSACPTSCSHYYRVKDGPYACHGESNEYGTTYPFGPKCGIDNLAAVLKIQTICDNLGLDTHSTGNTVCFAMECWQRGLLTLKDTDNLDLSWGNADAVIALLPRIAFRQGFGDVLADASQMASRQIPGSEICLKTVKSQEVSALYIGPKLNLVQALGYATAYRGADHLRGGVLLPAMGLPKLKELLGEQGAAKVMKEPRSIEGKGVFLALDQDFVAFHNSLEVCTFVVGGLRDAMMPDLLAELYSTATGVDTSGDDLMKIGERICNVEKSFNIREGGRRKDDTLPPPFFVEGQAVKGPPGPTGVSHADFQAMLSEHYKFRGWDEDGIPSKEKLAELGLEDIVAGYRGT
jgi:aldehyde:ferredoxin oxidoreductase